MMHGHENRLRHSSNEAAEQGRVTGSGGGGAKGGGQGEREPMLHVPDTGPGKRVTGAGARTDGREASRQSSEVGAVCRKAARTVLCGGRPVMGVPTAIASSSLRARAQMLFDQLVDPRRRFGLGQVTTPGEHHKCRVWHHAGEQLGICCGLRHSIFFALD